MTTTNDITGDKLKSKPSNDGYRNNYESIFGAKDMKVTSNKRPNNDGVIGSGSGDTHADGWEGF